MSRTNRIARALTVGYGFQAVVAVTGLVLTPFLLSRLGVADLGRWLVAGQVLGVLGLLDLGVTAVLPREVARASGSAGSESVAEVVRRAWWLVWLQTPLVALVALGVWLVVSAERPELGGPLAIVLCAFVVQFPLRVPGAVLMGLQELTFCAGATAAAWVVTTALSVGLVFGGWGLNSLAVGWATGQFVSCAASAARLRSRYRGAVGWAWPGRDALGGQLRASLWTSAAQLSQVLVAGTDLLVLAWVLGPSSAVVYSCTTKLIGLLSNQCYTIGLTAQPALAQLRAEDDPDRLRRAIRVTGSVMLLASGAVAVAVVAVNAAFVTRWVGPGQFAGAGVTLLGVAAMLTRHVAFSWWNVAYVLGAERRLAVVLLADGVLTVAATAAWAAVVGVAGAPLGSLTGALLVFAPTGLLTVAARLGVPPARVLGWVLPWALRLGAVLVPVALVTFDPVAATTWGGASLLAVGCGGYAVGAYSLFAREPLREYRDRVVASVRRMWPRSKAPRDAETALGEPGAGPTENNDVRAERATNP